ncbi:MAG: hypothetical protein K1563_18150 [Candidatus Thiodiazotropha sp. (ex. Lucinisca nassula)]|uniref:hypothetical protein n=1 Tax=Candidatus Thiodiazotropha sp. LNASS1 TaxID=3096260 RepID=UPI000D341D1C|nr:hypothetical protein [Candidatus Thiodiazotropha sp. (ex. Lucinisca nassula)]MBW9275605.1 hypothetical protein [Candidatus Thiodiazotropha sp. (ex. Lucinisca nassula)]MCG8026018.1 hypothetical protein [Candidatus Thiodiazotropha endolucinida]PUB76267.1 MAG: hypothetical protein DBP01_18795 [gamma proteobacterium symbiont of Ctena orbiculata]PUB79941.1 MAG: hypothetical protein DBP02_21585 [gamma proteobacterium symbiont of Ctena orbiculata]
MKNKTRKPRNLLHNHPMLRKGGVHDKTNKAHRRKAKQNLRKAWFSLSALKCTERRPCTCANSSVIQFFLI